MSVHSSTPPLTAPGAYIYGDIYIYIGRYRYRYRYIDRYRHRYIYIHNDLSIYTEELYRITRIV